MRRWVTVFWLAFCAGGWALAFVIHRKSQALGAAPNEIRLDWPLWMPSWIGLAMWTIGLIYVALAFAATFVIPLRLDVFIENLMPGRKHAG